MNRRRSQSPKGCEAHSKAHHRVQKLLVAADVRNEPVQGLVAYRFPSHFGLSHEKGTCYSTET